MAFNGPDTNRHKCMAAGCDRHVSYSYVMCVPHWRALKPETADGLYFAWSSYRNAPSAALGRKAKGHLDNLLQQANLQLTQP